MTYSLMKWILFTLLLLFAPALLFLVMAFMFIPAIFFAAGILYMIPKAVDPSRTSETLTFIGFFGVHLLIYVGIYFLISVMGAKLLFLIRKPRQSEVFRPPKQTGGLPQPTIQPA